MLTIQN